MLASLAVERWLERAIISRSRTSFHNALVFPGGHVDQHDHGSKWPVQPGMPRSLQPYRVAAARELFEECGLFLTADMHCSSQYNTASPNYAKALTLSDSANVQAQTLTSAMAFYTLHGHTGTPTDFSWMHHYAHWVTPTTVKTRFSTHFFVAALRTDVSAITPLLHLNTQECAAAHWFTPREALEYGENHWALHPPQWYLLNELSRQPRLTELLQTARSRVVVPYLPELHLMGHEQQQVVLLPGDVDHQHSTYVAESGETPSPTILVNVRVQVTTPSPPSVPRHRLVAHTCAGQMGQYCLEQTIGPWQSAIQADGVKPREGRLGAGDQTESEPATLE